MTLILELVNYQGNAPTAPTTKVFGARGGTLGRAPNSSWILPDPEKYISGTHAVIRYENGLYYLEDTSTNGVFINNTEKPIGKGCKVVLNDGDLLYIGEYQISVYIAKEQEQTADLASGESPTEDDDIVVKNYDSGKDQDSMRHVSYLEGKFGEQLGDKAITQDSEVLDRLIEDQPVLPNDAAISSRADQASQEDADNRAEAPLTDNATLCETHAIEAPEQTALPPSPTDHFILDEELHEADGRQQSFADQDSAELHDPIFRGDSKSAQSARIEVSPTHKTVSSEAVDDLASSEAWGETPASKPKFVEATSPESESARIMNAFIKGLGLKTTASSIAEPAETMELVGVCFRELIQGVMDILAVRASLKKEFRMTATTVHPIENNPLKFAMSVDEALPYLLLKQSTGFLSPLEAIQEGIQDVQDHHWAIIVAMQAAFEDLLKQFDPEVLEERFAKDSKLGALRKVNKMFKKWDSYCEHYEGLTKDAHSSFQRLFGERFVHAYEDQIERLSNARKRLSD